MEAANIIKGIEDFFSTADEAALAEVNAAFSVDIEGDLTFEEYLGGFNCQYNYSHSDASHVYTYSTKHHISIGDYSKLNSFEDTSSNYKGSDLTLSSRAVSKSKGPVERMIKTAS